MPKVLITPRSLTKAGHPSFELLEKAGYEVVYCTPGQQPDEAELVGLLPGCIGYLAGVERVSARALEAADILEVISRNGSGTDNIDAEAAKRKGITICKTEGANAKGVAELTIGLIYALARALPYHDGKLKARSWERRKGIELEGRTLGMIGCGQIGEETARRALGIGMKVLAYRRHPNRSFAPSKDFRWASLDEVIEGADVLSLHRPANPDGSPVVTAALLKRLKKGALLINTARGSLLDDRAVLAALEEGRLAGVATDVYDKEPPEDWSLARHERVIATPHIGAFTEESVERATVAAVENIIETLKRR
ncbi:MAG: phosphoglycerate dehydrogenase [Spirochaetales bacterium]|nr:phosphoglycerate dehydrogenase [Spirochaetales bacterium]